MSTLDAIPARIAEPESSIDDLDDLENSLKVAADETKAAALAGTSDTDEQQNDNSQNAGDSQEPVDRPPWMPKKFWVEGDLDASISKMGAGYQNLESAYGRMANDLGTQRQITDKVLAMDKRTRDLGDEPGKPQPPTVDAAALVDDPTKTLDIYWQQREKQLRQEMAQEAQATARAAEEVSFLNKHPDYVVTAQSSDFSSWVSSSPLRLRAAQMARDGDYSVADELLTEYTALQGTGPALVLRDDKGNAVASTGDPDLDAARAASTESAAQASGSGSGAAKSEGKIYRRSELIRLKVEKPELYADPGFQAEILRAYAEHRVR